jgi:hypothetical protein
VLKVYPMELSREKEAILYYLIDMSNIDCSD